jgi:lipopolysaccharide transport system ATP-binding protein
MRPAIRVDSLSKSYQLGRSSGPAYRTLRESLTGAAANAWHGLKRMGSRVLGNGRAEAGADAGEFWALKDVSFEVQPGEVVGIIGRNGAGKSTLLKILSRITDPTSGRADVRGRLGSLLEVGTGFHPELTGRENIYLNGSILGMSRREITAKFDEIVWFAEIERFLDTPVKRYSSGMYVRLAFAVAAHLEPEILIVDEVLAVGDIGFQRKCLGKMHSVSRTGRTVLFVSHNMAAVKTLCQQCIVLDQGSVAKAGSTEECIVLYSEVSNQDLVAEVKLTRPHGETAWMNAARLFTDSGVTTASIAMGDSLGLEVWFVADHPTSRPQLGFIIRSEEGSNVLNANTHYQTVIYPRNGLTQGVITCNMGAVPLMPGKYSVSLWFGTGHVDNHVAETVLRFEVLEKDIWGKGKLPPPKASYFWWPTVFSIHSQAQRPLGK